MYIYLLLSILSSTFLLIILKNFIFWKVETLHGIIVNYWTAATLSFMISPVENYNRFYILESVWPTSMMIGFLFIMVFYITAKTAQISGVAVASVASKMSMVIPIGAGLILYSESMDFQKGLGIFLAIPAVIITSLPSSKVEGTKTELNFKSLLLPAFLFLGAGLVDTAIKFAQHQFMTDENRQLVIMSIFGFAGIFGLLRLLFEIFILKKKLSWRSIGGGVLLGVTNYLSLLFLLRCLESPGSESSTVFAFVNTGVVITSFFAGILLFKEKPERNRLFGLALAITAIIILSY
jgi:drug/metabolite transporter (DMT)-like permease